MATTSPNGKKRCLDQTGDGIQTPLAPDATKEAVILVHLMHEESSLTQLWIGPYKLFNYDRMRTYFHVPDNRTGDIRSLPSEEQDEILARVTKEDTDFEKEWEKFKTAGREIKGGDRNTIRPNEFVKDVVSFYLWE